MVPRAERVRKGKDRESRGVADVLVKWLLLIIFVSFIGFLAVSNVRLLQRRAEVNQQLEVMQGEVARLEEKTVLYRARLAERQDPSYIEQQARERFNLKRPGEHVAVVLPPEEKQRKEGNKRPEEKSNSWWQRILAILGL